MKEDNPDKKQDPFCLQKVLSSYEVSVAFLTIYQRSTMSKFQCSGQKMLHTSVRERLIPPQIEGFNLTAATKISAAFEFNKWKMILVLIWFRETSASED